MNIRERMELAIQNAPVTAGFIESTNDLSAFKDEEDDYTVHLNKETSPDLPNEVTLDVGYDSGLRRLLEAYVTITGISLSREYIEYAQQHERQHYRAAEHLGATTARIGVRIFNVELSSQESRLAIQPSIRVQDFKTTKLGAALVSGYPIPPSKDDEIDIKAYGYSGIEELADIAMKRNAARKNSASEQFYPVPLGSGSRSEASSFFMPQGYVGSLSEYPRA